MFIRTFLVGVLTVAELRVKVRLVGPDEEGGRVRFADFLHFCRTLSACLRRSEIAVGVEGGRLHYQLVNLADGSAVWEVEPLPRNRGRDQRREVVGFFNKTVADLRENRKPDRRLDPAGLRDFKELYAGVKHTKEVWVGGAQLTSRYVANIDELLRPVLTSEGSVTGFLERLNVHNKNEFVLFPVLGGLIPCAFPEEMFAQVLAAVKCNVTVYGTLFYPNDSRLPSKVQIKSLEVHPKDDQLPTLGELRGTFRGCTEGKTAVEFVRAIRDEQD